MVDDEDTILDIGASILERFGYKTIVARSGEEAVGLFRGSKTDVDLVILDLTMPGMGGQKCLETLLEENPGLKVIITSGMATDETARKAMASGAAGFIAKPFQLADILGKVRTALDTA